MKRVFSINMKVVVTIPAYNEEKTLPNVLKEIKGVMDDTPYYYEIMVLNDGSKDKTEETAREHGATVFSNARNMGLSETFKHEMKRCIELGADIIVHTDADGQYKASDIPKLIKKIEEGNDLVLGSRFAGKIEGMSLSKRIGNRMFAWTFSRLLGFKLTDTTTGFRAFTAHVATEIEFINTFTYTQEQIIRAAKQGFKIAEVPINTRKTRESRLFKSPLEYAVKAWINILRIHRDYNPIKFFGKLGLWLMGIGVFIGFYLLYVLFRYGVGVIDTKIPTVILSVVFFLTGFQVLIFGFLADMMKK